MLRESSKEPGLLTFPQQLLAAQLVAGKALDLASRKAGLSCGCGTRR